MCPEGNQLNDDYIKDGYIVIGGADRVTIP